MTGEIPETLRIVRERALGALSPEDRRRLLEDGTMFARFTIRQQTRAAEAAFQAWKDAGRPDDVGQAGIKFLKGAINQCLASLRALSDDDISRIWGAGPDDREELLASLVKGLGCPKASFALACAGIGTRGCIDSHLVKAHFEALEDLLSTVARRERSSRDWKEEAYKEACRRLWGSGDTAARQWEEWLSAGITDTNHAVLVN